MKSVFVLGLAVVDFIHFVDNIPRGGLKHLSRRAEISGGGTGANAAVAVSRLDGRAMLGARLGDDLISKIVIDGLKQDGVAVDFIQRNSHADSPFSSVFVDRSGERQIVSYRGSGLSESTDWITGLPQFDACLADLRWPPGLEALLRLARKRDVPAVVDGERSEALDSIWLASHVAFSRPGIHHLTGETDIPKAIRSLAPVCAGWMCVTDGENGVFRSKDGKIEHIPAFKVNARNTLAAGDVWHGAFTLRLAEGADEDDAIVFANAAAAIRCARIEGRSSFPARAEVEDYLNAAR